MASEIKRDAYNFAITKNYPSAKSFTILKEPETSTFAMFLKTFSKLLKGA